MAGGGGGPGGGWLNGLVKEVPEGGALGLVSAQLAGAARPGAPPPPAGGAVKRLALAGVSAPRLVRAPPRDGPAARPWPPQLLGAPALETPRRRGAPPRPARGRGGALAPGRGDARAREPRGRDPPTPHPLFAPPARPPAPAAGGGGGGGGCAATRSLAAPGASAAPPAGPRDPKLTATFRRAGGTGPRRTSRGRGPRASGSGPSALGGWWSSGWTTRCRTGASTGRPSWARRTWPWGSWPPAWPRRARAAGSRPRSRTSNGP